jgi:quinohemoprotein ethanol dehydrogenase
LKWYFQYAHHDMWDFDGPQPTILLEWNGIPAIEHTSKTGYMWILNRATGKSLVGDNEVAIPPTPANAAFQHPAPTQPESSIESLVEHQASQLPATYTAAPLWATPGPATMIFQPFGEGGMEWPPAAYSPRTHMIYSHSRYFPGGYGVTNDAATDPACQPGHTTYACGLTKLLLPVPGAGVNHGVYGAVNTVTGKVAWTIPTLTTPPDSGMTVAGDLVFFGDNTGLLYAANAASGQILWVFDAMTMPGAGGANASAAVYEISGVEYIVYGFGGNPGESFVLGDAVIAFALPPAMTAAAAKTKAIE